MKTRLCLLVLLPAICFAATGKFEADYFTTPAALRSLDRVDQWGLEVVRLDASLRQSLAADAAAGAVVVAVIDTGLDYDHPDLGIDNLWMNTREKPNGVDDDGNGYIDDFIGWDFIDADNDPWDWVGHGTHVAGTVAAHSGNGIGIAGVAPHARIMALRALNSEGRGWSTRIARAIMYAVDNGAVVINLSMAVKDVSVHEQEAMRYAHAHDVVVVVAAGNAGDDAGQYTPASIDGVIVVAALDREGVRATYSNWGAVVDIAAPGTDIVSLRAANTDFMLITAPDARPLQYAAGPRTEYYRATGTSFAVPFVSGAAALLRAQSPSLSGAAVERILKQSAKDVGAPGVDQYSGYGALDVAAALVADPNFYIEAHIEGAAAVVEGGKPYLRVSGTAAADTLGNAWLEIGAGDAPTSWLKVSRDIHDNITDGILDAVDANHFAAAKRWTLRVVVQHKSGRQREARFLLNLG